MGDLGMGTWSAGLTVVVVAVAADRGHAALSGALLAAGALGSIVISLLSGAGRVRARTSTRYVCGAFICAIGLLVLLFSTELAIVAGAMVVVGAGLGLENVAVFQALDVVSPVGRATEAFTWLTTSSAVGAAIGAGVSGQLIHHNSTGARLFVFAVAATSAGTLFGQRRRFDGSASRSPDRTAT